MITLPNLLPLVVLIVAVELLAAAAIATVVVGFFVQNHRVRVRRQESIPAYYRQLVAVH